MVQKTPAGKLRFPQHRLSRIETGRVPIDVVVIRALATEYGRSIRDIGSLFVRPTREEWARITARHEIDPRFSKAPDEAPRPLPRARRTRQ